MARSHMNIMVWLCLVGTIGLSSNGNSETWTPEKTKPSKAELKKRLTDVQFNVTQNEGTERPFGNEYWNNKADGLYVDVVSGEPLFSSRDKYDSGTGWPSFTKPLVKENIIERKDADGDRVEVRSKHADSHLGHVFTDGPAPTGLRYCMNSASLRFIPRAKLKDSGYAAFEKYFSGQPPPNKPAH